MKTIKDIVKKTRELCLARPDTKYLPATRGQGCSNLIGECSDGTTGCIVGQVLRDIGFTYEDILPANSRDAEGTIECLLGHSAWDDHEDELRWLSDIQSKQDSGLSWGEAMGRANAFFTLPEEVFA